MLPSLRVCWTSTWCSWDIYWLVPEIMLAMAISGSVTPWIAEQTSKLSLSKTTFWIAMSQAKTATTSSALASTYNAPKGSIKFLLIAATTLPWSSLVITPIPVHLCLEKTAPSVFTLYHPIGGGVHLLLPIELPWGWIGFSYTAKYSSNSLVANP